MSSFSFCMQANITSKQSQGSTPRKRQSTPNVGYMDSIQDAEATFSLTRSSSTHSLCSVSANPKIEIPTTLFPIAISCWRAAKNDSDGRSLPIPVIEASPEARMRCRDITNIYTETMGVYSQRHS